MENKQTAVEWLVEQMIQHGLVPKGTHSDNVLFHKAKAMQKQQAMEFLEEYDSYVFRGGSMSVEQYYNEIYGK